MNIESVTIVETETIRDLALLEEIEKNPDVNQADLATQLGVAVGTVNWHIKRLIAKGAIKVSRVSRKKLRYIITPEGLALRAGLTVDYIQQSFKSFRLLRSRTLELVPALRAAGYDHVTVEAEEDAWDVIRLSLLESGITVSEEPDLPRIQMTGLKLVLILPHEAAS